MKKTTITAILLVSTTLSACVCAPQLTAAFDSIKAYITTQNLPQIKSSLESLNQNIDNNTQALKAAKPLIKKSNDVYIEKIVEAKKILFMLEQEERMTALPSSEK